MKQRLPEFERNICELMKQYYAFSVSTFEFVPVGDSAFSYLIQSTSQESRYLKVFDTATKKGRMGVQQLNQYLPLMMELSEYNLFRNLSKPYFTLRGDLHCNSGRFICVLFEYIDGETLADAYPFSNHVQTRIAIELAKLHTVPIRNLQSHVVRESYRIDFGESLHTNLKNLESYKNNDPIIQKLQSIVLPKLELINRFWSKVCEHQIIALQSAHEAVLCHGDVWGGNIIDQKGKLVFIDWESAIIAPIERDLFSYVYSDYAAFLHAYADQRQIDLSLKPDLVAFYTYRHQLRNLNQWLHNLLNENFGFEQKQNDLEMIEVHCLDRWTSIEATFLQLFNK